MVGWELECERGVTERKRALGHDFVQNLGAGIIAELRCPGLSLRWILRGFIDMEYALGMGQL